MKTNFNFNGLNLTSLYPTTSAQNRKQNLAYTRNLREFLPGTSREHYNEPYEIGYQGCCWKAMTPSFPATSNQQQATSLEFKVTAKVFDVTNVAPRITLPSMWYINLECDSTLDLHPFDINENDIIKCRWAKEDEAGFASINEAKRPFMKLNSEKCKPTFDSKIFRKFYQNVDWSELEFIMPIAIMIEDSQNEVIRSSMPVQFLAGNMLLSDTSATGNINKREVAGVPSKNDHTAIGLNNGADADDLTTIDATENFNCDLIPVLTSIKDLKFTSEQEPEIKRSFDIYKDGRNRNKKMYLS